MKNQALFASKDKSKKLKCCPLQFLFGALRVRGKIMHTFINFRCHMSTLDVPKADVNKLCVSNGENMWHSFHYFT